MNHYHHSAAIAKKTKQKKPAPKPACSNHYPSATSPKSPA